MKATTTARGAAPAGRAALSGLRVLFMPKNSRTTYFRSLLRSAKDVHGWMIDVVGPRRHATVWQGIARDFFDTPDFTQRQPWEDDADFCAGLDAFISSCEQASGIPSGRIFLAGERDLGRGFSARNFYWFRNGMARRVMADNTEPARIVRRMFAFARAALEKSAPDLVIAGEWADTLCFTLYLAARQMGIPCAVNRFSKLWSGRCYWSFEPQMYNTVARDLVATLRAEAAPVSGRAGDKIADFRNRPNTLGYVQQNWNMIDRHGWIGGHLDVARTLAAQIRHRWRGGGGTPPKPAFGMLWDLYRRAYLAFRQGGFFRRFSEDELRATQYIYIALHKDPEQALNYQSPAWSNQYDTIALLSGILPDGCVLMAREHRNNRGRRATRFYKNLRRLPGVHLVDGFDDQFKYIRNAAMIVTENGTSGWEGLLLGRRVLLLDELFYSAAGLARRVTEPETIGATIVQTLAEPAVTDAAEHDRNLGWMLDAEWQTSAPLDDPDFSETLALLGRLLTLTVPQQREVERATA